jgi:hypothetical protein
MRGLWLAVAVVMGCNNGAEAPEGGASKEKKGCELSLDALEGKSFVKGTQTGNQRQLDLLARVLFEKEGDQLVARYTARALADVYTYDCKPGDGKLTCWAREFEASNWCRALWANEKGCTPEAVSELTGKSVEEVKPKVEETLKNIKSLSGAAMHQARTVFSTGQVQLRGFMTVGLNAEDCRLVISDRFQTMTNGQVVERENVVGTSQFFPNTRDLVFEHCKDNHLVVLEKEGDKPKDGVTREEGKKGEMLPVRFSGTTDLKPEAGCTYAQKGYAAYVAVGPEGEVPVGADGALQWGFQGSFATPGRSLLHLVRYKTCGDKPKQVIDTTCQAINIRD